MTINAGDTKLAIRRSYNTRVLMILWWCRLRVLQSEGSEIYECLHATRVLT